MKKKQQLFYFLLIFYNKLKILKLIKIFKTLLFIKIISFAIILRTNCYQPKQSNRFKNLYPLDSDSIKINNKIIKNVHMSNPLKIPLQLQRQREQRHQKLMKMITSYELTREEKAKLQKIRSHTMLEINLRFLRSQINRNYKFPKPKKSSQVANTFYQALNLIEQKDEQLDKDLQQQFQQLSEKSKSKRRPAEYLTYDLKSQNQIKNLLNNKDNELMTYSNKILSLEQSRRVHSLGNQKSLEKQKQDFITKKHSPVRNSKQKFSKSPQNIGQSKSTKSLKVIKPISLTRRESKQKVIEDPSLQKHSPFGSNMKKLIVDSRKLKLPQINSVSSNQLKSLRKLNPLHQKLKTQKFYTQEQIEYAIGKKLVTQAADSGKKAIKGVQKYLKQIETQNKHQFNLNINNQSSKFMKKQKDPQKRRGNFQIFQSAKHSLKRQIE